MQDMEARSIAILMKDFPHLCRWVYLTSRFRFCGEVDIVSIWFLKWDEEVKKMTYCPPALGKSSLVCNYMGGILLMLLLYFFAGRVYGT